MTMAAATGASLIAEHGRLAAERPHANEQGHEQEAGGNPRESRRVTKRDTPRARAANVSSAAKADRASSPPAAIQLDSAPEATLGRASARANRPTAPQRKGQQQPVPKLQPPLVRQSAARGQTAAPEK